MILACNQITKSFDGVVALERVSLRFAAGSVTGIIGPNGAGKTTLLNVLTGFLRPDTGRWFVAEQEVTGLAAHRINRMGLARTFQELRLISELTAIDNVMLARPLQRGEQLFRALLRIGMAREQAANRNSAARLLDLVGLGSKRHDLAGTLSFGEQKLLTLACCMANQPRILFLDEPVSGVHPKMLETILDILDELRRDGRSVVFIEHNISAVRDLADTVVVMDEGRVIAEGVPDEVLNRPEILEAYVA